MSALRTNVSIEKWNLEQTPSYFEITVDNFGAAVRAETVRWVGFADQCERAVVAARVGPFTLLRDALRRQQLLRYVVDNLQGP
jgi:hypothetical protein